MKRKSFIISVIVVVGVGVLVGLLFLSYSTEEPNVLQVGTFSIDEYQWEMQTFSTDQNVGEVKDENAAIIKAKEVWSSKYDADFAERIIKVAYDVNEECWHIYSKFSSKNRVGGGLHAIIQKNGDLCAVWRDD